MSYFRRRPRSSSRASGPVANRGRRAISQAWADLAICSPTRFSAPSNSQTNERDKNRHVRPNYYYDLPGMFDYFRFARHPARTVTEHQQYAKLSIP